MPRRPLREQRKQLASDRRCRNPRVSRSSSIRCRELRKRCTTIECLSMQLPRDWPSLLVQAKSDLDPGLAVVPCLTQIAPSFVSLHRIVGRHAEDPRRWYIPQTSSQGPASSTTDPCPELQMASQMQTSDGVDGEKRSQCDQLRRRRQRLLFLRCRACSSPARRGWHFQVSPSAFN